MGMACPGVWVRAGVCSNAPGADSFQSRLGSSASLAARHVWSNLRIVRPATHTLETTAIQLTIEQTEPSLPNAQVRVNDLFDTLHRDAQGTWRFARRIISREMALRMGG